MRLFTGCDIVQIERFSEHLSDVRFLDKCFTEEEQKYCFAKSSPAQHFAARFAGKEAVLKALSGLDVRYGIGHVEIVISSTGRPAVEFIGEAISEKKLPPELIADLSLSHDGEYAMATAVVYLP